MIYFIFERHFQMYIFKYLFYLIIKIQSAYSKKARRWRGELFHKTLRPDSDNKILDIGSGTGEYFHWIVKSNKNVYISDINLQLLSIAKNRFGYNTIKLDASKTLPFRDKYFDNSVLFLTY